MLADAADRAKVACAEMGEALTPETIARLESVRGRNKAWENVKETAPRAGRPNDSTGTVRFRGTELVCWTERKRRKFLSLLN